MVKQAGKFVSYLRVSTDKQGLRGLGIAAQRRAVLEYLDGGKWQLVAEFVEQESGKRSDRPRPRDGLAYESQQQTEFLRGLRKAQKIRVRLGGTPNLLHPFPEKPKGMHWRSYRRIKRVYETAKRSSK